MQLVLRRVVLRRVVATRGPPAGPFSPPPPRPPRLPQAAYDRGRHLPSPHLRGFDPCNVVVGIGAVEAIVYPELDHASYAGQLAPGPRRHGMEDGADPAQSARPIETHQAVTRGGRVPGGGVGLVEERWCRWSEKPPNHVCSPKRGIGPARRALNSWSRRVEDGDEHRGPRRPRDGQGEPSGS